MPRPPETTELTRGRSYRTLDDGRLAVRRVRVRIVDGPDRGLEAALDDTSLLIGKGAAADLRLSDRATSRTHLELSVAGTRVRVRDLGSTNGTFVGEVQIECVLLPLPAHVRVGRTRIELTAEDLPVGELPSAQNFFGRVLGEGPAMRRAFQILEQVREAPSPVWIEGEAGVGKTECAAALGVHRTFDLRRRVPVDALTEALAQEPVVLDHLHAATPDLLRALEPALEAHPTRVVTTVRGDLRPRVEQGLFPIALYHRLAVVRVVLPPLRERPEDLFAIALQAAEELGASGWRPSPAWLEAARREPLAQNARELRQRVALTLNHAGAPDETPASAGFKEARQRVVDSFERAYVEDLVQRHDGNLAAAAREAGLSRNHLAALCKKHGLARGRG